MKRRRSIIWVGGVVAFVGLLSIWIAGGFDHAMSVEVATAPVTTGAIARHVVATGTLQAVTTVQIGAQVSGTIESLDADYNSIVHVGQVLARLDPALFNASLGEAEASLAQAKAAEDQARADRNGLETAVTDARTKLNRAESLAAGQLIPQSDLDAAHIAMDSAVADLSSGDSRVQQAGAAVKEAQAAVDQAKINVAHTIISSPIDGIVVARNVDVGQTVASTYQAPVLFNIAADLRKMEVEVDIDEADIGAVQSGESATFGVESYPNQTFNGTVSVVRLQPVVDQTTPAATAGQSTVVPTTAPGGTVVSYATIIDVANPDEKLRPGMTATVRLDGARRDGVVRIPNTALEFRPSLQLLQASGQGSDRTAAAEHTGEAGFGRVWEFNGSRFTPVDVRVGLADDQWTELVGTSIEPGAKLVTSASLVAHRRATTTAGR